MGSWISLFSSIILNHPVAVDRQTGRSDHPTHSSIGSSSIIMTLAFVSSVSFMSPNRKRSVFGVAGAVS